MPEHRYLSSRMGQAERERLVRKVALGLGGMFVLVLVGTSVPAVRRIVLGDPRILALALAAWYLTFVRPYRGVARAQRFSERVILSTRRGITLRDGKRESTLLWREVDRADVDTEGLVGAAVAWRQMRLRGREKVIVLSNDPRTGLLEGCDDLYGRVVRQVGQVVHNHVGFSRACPLCGWTEARALEPCSGCGQVVRRVSPWLRPWRLLPDDAFYLCLLPLLLGPALLPVAVACLLALVLAPWIEARRRSPSPLRSNQTTPETEEQAERTQASVPARRAVVFGLGVLLTALCMHLGCHAQPGLSAPVSPAVRATATEPSSERPREALPERSGMSSGSAAQMPTDADYLPLAVGNTWEYACNGTRVVQRVTAEELVNGVRCWVLESFVGGEAESTQRESFAVSPQGLTVLKRAHRGADLFLSPGEPMLSFPVRTGRRWTWSGSADQGAVTYEFLIEGPTTLSVAGRSLLAVPVSFTGRAADGSDLQARRWYVRGIGMVREKTVLRKGTKVFRLEAVLQNFALRVPSSPTGLPTQPSTLQP